MHAWHPIHVSASPITKVFIVVSSDCVEVLGMQLIRGGTPGSTTAPDDVLHVFHPVGVDLPGVNSWVQICHVSSG